MVVRIMICTLIGLVALILACGAIATPLPASISIVIISPSAIIKEEHEIMYNEDFKNIFKEGVVAKSIGVMRKDGIDDEVIKKKMIESFSLDEETINIMLKQ